MLVLTTSPYFILSPKISVVEFGPADWVLFMHNNVHCGPAEVMSHFLMLSILLHFMSLFKRIYIIPNILNF